MAAGDADSSSAPVRITFRLAAVLGSTQFLAAKLAPGRNNVRAHASGDKPLPTPSYNAAILQVRGISAT